MQALIKEIIKEHGDNKEALMKTARELMAAAHLLSAYCGLKLCEQCVYQGVPGVVLELEKVLN